MKRVRLSRKILVSVLAVAAVVVAALGLIAFASVWTDYQWYRSLGQENVFFVRIASQLVTWLVCAVVAFAILQTAGALARTASGSATPTSRVVLLGSLLLAAASGVTMSQQWMTFRLAIAGAPFGAVDPQFGRDIGFFVFSLPALEAVRSWLLGLIVLAAVWSLAIVFVPKGPELSGQGVTDKLRLRGLLFTLFGFLLLATALGYWLSIWQLDLSSTGQLAGAAYTDVHARIPAYWTLAVLTVLTAIAFFGTARSKRWRLPLTALAVWVVAVIALGSVWPMLMQSYVVAPNEASLELPYIERNITMTRSAFGLQSSGAQSYPAVESLTATAAQSAIADLRDARLWTPTSVKQAYVQLQTVRPYYKLSTIDVDRYRIDGTPAEVLVAGREIDPSALPDTARTWVNQHLVYTHGFGITMSSASNTTPQGFPQSLVADIPPSVASTIAATSPDLASTQPRIYFGPSTVPYAILNTGIDEFDYPVGEDNTTYRYEAETGVRLGSFMSRLAWAVRLRSDQILFSEYLTEDSQVLINRDIKTRVSKLAPWLTLDDNAYPALVEGRIIWILDAYTSSDHFPYSQPVKGTNYLRNSVKITVDAYTGETRFYAIGDDPIRDAWASIYPTIITPERDVPASVADHFRYPKRLFATQAAIYQTYHMTDPTVFYNKEDQWALSSGQSSAASQPTYVMLDLPGTAGKSLYMIQTFTPYGKDNIVGWLAISCGPQEYGKQTAYLMPKDHVTLGPSQIMARIMQDPVISPQLTLWDQRGSSVIFGEMLTLPVQESVAYIQPVFIQSKGASMTQLVAVVVAAGDRIVMAPTLEDALQGAYGPPR